ILVEADAEPVEPAVRVIEPERPYSNLMHLRETIRSCKDFIRWVEPHLPRKVLEVLVTEADAARISEIRLLSGDKTTDEQTKKDWKRFACEMANLGIAAEWRFVPHGVLGVHDRY